MINVKRKFVAEGNIEVTDELVESLAEKWERGEGPGKPGPFIAGPGRPPLYEDQLRTISVKLPSSIVDVIDDKARALGESRSQYVRHTIMADLMEA